MNFHAVILCAVAGLTGWGGMAWWRGETGRSHRSDRSDKSDSSDHAGLPNPSAARSPHKESTRLSQLAAELAALPEDRLQARAEEIAKWPPGTARELALALLAARLAPADDPPPDPLAVPPEDAELALNKWEVLEQSLQRGQLDAFDLFGAIGETVGEWASSDPSAASTIILKLPAGVARQKAVDAAAAVMSRSDPQAAWDFVLQAGEKYPGSGTARAWLKFIEDARTRDLSGLANGLSLTQQESLARTLTQLVRDSPSYMAGAEELPDIITASFALADSPARQELAEVLAECNYGALLIGSGGMNFMDPRICPEHAALTTQGLLAMLDPQHSLGLPWLTDLGKGGAGDEHSVETLSFAAPRLLPAMARAGHVREAVELYERIPDANAQRAALEGLLPAWMDADPQAARAAFNAAPFTALEREKWQRHPAFLLHPDSGE